MAKKVLTLIKLQIPGGQANPAPPVGPALGQHGVNIMEFCKAFNAQTAQENGRITPVEITVYEDRSFDFITKTPPAAVLIKEALRLEKGSAEPNRDEGRQPDARPAPLDRRDEDGGPERARRRAGDARDRRHGPDAWAWRWRSNGAARQALPRGARRDRPRAALHAGRGGPAAQGRAGREVRRDGRGAHEPRPERPPRGRAAARDDDAPARHRPRAARRRLRRGRQGPRGRGGRRGRRRLGRPREADRGGLHRLRRRDRDAGPDGQRRPARPRARPARPDAEPEDRHRHVRRRQGRPRREGRQARVPHRPRRERPHPDRQEVASTSGRWSRTTRR